MMNTRLMVLACAVVGLAVGCEDAQKSGPAGLQVGPAAEDLMDLLPAWALAAVEFRGLESRWEELRSIPALAGLQDHMLDELGLKAEDVPAIAGPRAIVALLADENARRIVPVAVLDPPSFAMARQRLSESESLLAVEARNALWVGPANQARLVERVAAGDGTSLSQAIDTGALAERLPTGGLVRVVVNPRAVGRWLRRWAEYHALSRLRPLARLVAADLEAVDVCGFRRDIVRGELVTHLWVGIDADVVPAAVLRALAADRGPAALPPALPPKALIAKSFRIEPAAGLAWLRSVAARDSDGPLRQLDFWIDEFEARSGRDVERDIVAALGERGMSLVLESADGGGVELVAIIDARDSDRLEATLLDLRDWLGEQIGGRTLGLARSGSRLTDDAHGAAHAFDIWTPFGRYSGPVFQLADHRLVIATSESALSLGLRLAGSAGEWITPAWASVDGPPDEIAVVRLKELGRMFEAAPVHSVVDSPWLGVVGGFLSRTGDGRLRIDYEPDGFRVIGWLALDSGR